MDGPLSSKAIIMLGDAVAYLHKINYASEWKLHEAYDLWYGGDEDGYFRPDSYQHNLQLIASMIDPETQRPAIFQVIEALHNELACENPAVFKRRTVQRSGADMRTTTEWPEPAECFFRQLKAEGYTVLGGLVQPLDSEAPEEHKDKTALASLVRSHDELDPNMLIHHVEASDDAVERRQWHPAAGEARSFLEGLVVKLASTESKELGKPIPKLPKAGERRSKFGPCREFLRSIEFTNGVEDEMIASLYSIASETGGHPGITDEQAAHFVRRLCWVTGYYLLKKYEAWKERGRHW